MLKKAGIVAAAATAALVALTPLAFADNGDHGPDRDETTNVWVEEDGVERDQVNVCEFDQDILDEAGIGAAAVVTQTQTDNCVNAGDGAEVPDAAPAPALPLVG